MVDPPSVKLDDLLQGRTTWNDADPAIRSWARLSIYHAAKLIAEAPTAPKRVEMLKKIPPNLHHHVKKEAERLYLLRK